MPPVGTPLTLGPIEALRVLALVCLLRSINAETKKKNRWNEGVRELYIIVI